MIRAIRHAVRSVRRWRSAAVTAALTLAIGIGTATSLYAFFRAVLNSAPHIEDPGTVGRIYASSTTLGVDRAPLSLNDFQLAAVVSSFESVAAYTVDDTVMAMGAQTATVSAGQVRTADDHGADGYPSAIVIGVCRDALSFGTLMRSGVAPADIYVPFDTESTGELLLLRFVMIRPRFSMRPSHTAIPPSILAWRNAR